MLTEVTARRRPTTRRHYDSGAGSDVMRRQMKEGVRKTGRYMGNSFASFW